MRLLADENCPHPLVARLRERGHDVVWVHEVQPGASDEDVVARASRETRVLLTFDKDFGEIAYRAGVAAPSGVILLRISAPGPDVVAAVVLETLDKYPGWEGTFSVIEDTRVRRERRVVGAAPQPVAAELRDERHLLQARDRFDVAICHTDQHDRSPPSAAGLEHRRS